MKNFLESNKDIGILILRIVIGIAFALVYGLMKIEGGPVFWEQIGSAMSNAGISFGHTVWGFLASLSEFGGGILIFLGLFTRVAAAFMGFTMCIAIMQHLSMHDQWYNVFNPLEMLAVFIMLIFTGAGKYSLDYFIKKRNVSN